jgi:hypothetical protein
MGACAVLLLASVAFAQTATPNPPPSPRGEQIDEPGWRHHKRNSGEGIKMKGKSFAIMLGKGHRLRVNCGQEPMKDCIAAAQPLIDAFNKAEAAPPKAQ